MKLKTKRLSLGIGIVVGLAALLEVHQLALAQKRQVTDPRFLKASRALAAGETFSLKDFSFAAGEISKKEQGFLTDQDLDEVQGRVLLAAVGEGELLNKHHLASKKRDWAGKIPRGGRAYSLHPENWLPLKQGDVVDVLVKLNQRSEGVFTLMESVSVLSVREAAKEIVIAAMGHEIELLENATDHGKLLLALRNPEDSHPTPRRPAVNRFRRGPKSSKSIDIVTEGE